MHVEWSRQYDCRIAVLPRQGGIGVGTGVCGTGWGKGGFMGEILIEFIKGCCLTFSVRLGLSIPNSHCVTACFSEIFICAFLSTSTSPSQSNWCSGTIVVLVHACCFCLGPFMACPWTEPQTNEKVRKKAGRRAGQPGQQASRLLNGIWFCKELGLGIRILLQSCLQLSVGMSCCSQCRFFLTPLLSPVILHLFCFHSPSHQWPSETGQAPWAPSWLWQLFYHDE